MISQQTQRALVRVPEVQGLPLRKARLVLENAGLLEGSITFQESYQPRDQVLAQKPARGQMIYAGESVALTVSRESYIKWLPSIYRRKDERGRNVFADLLWVIQHVFSSVEETLDVVHTFFDPYEAPEKFLPWLASWSAMVMEVDWPVAKKRRLIKRAIELYRIRGTVKGLKLFIALFTGHEPDLHENSWPFRGWRVGVTSGIGIDSVVLPPVNLAHTFVVEMPVTYRDLSTEAVIRIHEIIRMEKPAHTEYYLRFAVENRPAELREFFAIGTRSGIGVGLEASEGLTSEAELIAALKEQSRIAAAPRAVVDEAEDLFAPLPRVRAPLPKAPRADLAPVEGQEPRSSEAGFGASAREMRAVSEGDLGTLTREMRGASVTKAETTKAETAKPETAKPETATRKTKPAAPSPTPTKPPDDKKK